MKRLLVLMLVTVLIAVPLAGCGGNGDDPGNGDDEPGGDSTLIVGSPEISGDFVTGFSNSAYDRWVRVLINGYETYSTTPDGEIVLNETVVENLETEIDEATGDKTYRFKIYEDMKWNNGDPITAKDYVFNVLWAASYEWVEAGASHDTTGDGLLGYTAYHDGETDRFKGVNLVDDYTFELIIDGAELPYFFETSYASVTPYPMDVWMPDAEIDINDDGAKLDGDLAAATSEIATVERFKPTVTCGPYNFVSFENNAVTVERNPEFKGNFEGKTPQIETVVVRSINQTTDIDMVISGEVDAITGVIEGEKIEAAKSASTTNTNYYPRNGFGGVYIHCDFGPTADQNVRHALAYLMDRDEIINNVLGGYGSVVNGHYGLAQWMYEDNKAAIDSFPHFTRDIEKANEFLDQTEWLYEEDGTTEFDPAKAEDGGYFRHNADGERLVIKHFGTEDNEVTDNVEIQFKANAHLAGIEWDLAIGDFDALLENYYYGPTLGDDREYHTFNLASTFSVAYDPYYSFHSNHLGTTLNTEQVDDPEIDELTLKMRRLDPTDTETYSEYWLEFQERFAEYLPIIPLYSNEYYDIFRTEVSGFNTTPFVSWAEVICDISVDK